MINQTNYKNSIGSIIIAVLTSISASVFDDCGNASTPTDVDAPTACCYTDPPLGCIITCPNNLGDGDGFDFITVNCDGPGSGGQAQAFLAYALQIQDQAHNNGTFPCTSANSGMVYTPCGSGFQPSLNPSNQDTESCVVPTFNCAPQTDCTP